MLQEKWHDYFRSFDEKIRDAQVRFVDTWVRYKDDPELRAQLVRPIDAEIDAARRRMLRFRSRYLSARKAMRYSDGELRLSSMHTQEADVQMMNSDPVYLKLDSVAGKYRLREDAEATLVTATARALQKRLLSRGMAADHYHILQGVTADGIASEILSGTFAAAACV